jgi:hypothetical protein
MKYMITNKDLYEEIQVSRKEKKRNQVKSRFYYIFWGAATISVLVGQLYVGTGYRLMSGSIFELIETLEQPKIY